MYRLRSCPLKLIPDSILGFLKVMRFHKDFPGTQMPPYDQISPRFKLAHSAYNVAMSDWIKAKAEE